jgi:hypothetical protein
VIPPVILPVVRRAILDLMFDVGGEHNDDVLAQLLASLGHRVARRDVKEQLLWLRDQGFIAVEELGPYSVARILQDGRDVAEGRLTAEGVSRFKTGD